MEYPKQVMRTSELVKMGFTRGYLDRAFHFPGQTFAWTETPGARTSPRMFDTTGFERWRREQQKIEREARPV